MKTRKELVLDLLKARINEWVDGPEIANERVGGSEGLKRLRELRQEGHDIRMRKHPDSRRDIFQYKLVTNRPVTYVITQAQTVTPMADRPFPLTRNPDGSFDTPIKASEARPPVPKPKPKPAPGQSTWVDAMKDDPTLQYKTKPTKIEFGVTVPCPRCGGRTTKKSPDVAVDPTYTSEKCRRCGGVGVVPNVGPV